MKLLNLDHWRRRAFDRFFEAVARVADFSSDLRAARDDVQLIRDVAYGPHPVAHRLDIYRPRDVPRPLPVLLYIHGGAFMLCSKETHRGLALLNAQRAGHLVFNINYRLAPRHPFPSAIADACAAYAWVVAHCAEYGGDPSRITVAGESAGGNLALGVAIACCYKRPETWARQLYALPAPVGVMPLMPFLQTSQPHHRRAPNVGTLVQSVFRGIERAYLGMPGDPSRDTRMADPVRVLEECGAPDRPFPPLFSGAGTADPCVADVRRLAQACQRLGIPIQTAYFHGEAHGFHALRWRRAARSFWRRSLAFLARVSATGSRPAPRPQPYPAQAPAVHAGSSQATVARVQPRT